MGINKVTQKTVQEKSWMFSNKTEFPKFILKGKTWERFYFYSLAVELYMTIAWKLQECDNNA